MSCRLILGVAVSKREMYSPIIEKQKIPYLNKGTLFPVDFCVLHTNTIFTELSGLFYKWLFSSGLAIFVSESESKSESEGFIVNVQEYNEIIAA